MVSFSMSMFAYFYTIALLIICVITATVCCSAYLVSHSKRYLPQMFGFIFYFAELSSLFAGEWAVQNISHVDVSNYYEIQTPALRILLGAAILACIWMVVFDMLDIHDPKAVAVPTAGIIVAQALILMLPYGAVRQWLFYSMRQVSLAACLIFTAVRTHRSDDPILKQRMRRRKNLLITMACLTCAIFVEDTLVILVWTIPPRGSDFLALFLSSRNFSETVMMVFLAVHVSRTAISSLRLRYIEPPQASGTPAESVRDADLEDHIMARLPSYAAEHSLSKREQEVLKLVIEGRTNHQIATELVLAEGTIKTHLHNIMKKCGQSNREELRRDFWAS